MQYHVQCMFGTCFVQHTTELQNYLPSLPFPPHPSSSFLPPSFLLTSLFPFFLSLKSSPNHRSRSKSPRRLPDLPNMDESNDPLRRRNARKTKRVSASSSEERTVSKGQTIVHSNERVRILRYTEVYDSSHLCYLSTQVQDR